MIGAIAGDVIGSIFEHSPTKYKEFPLFDFNSRFTDDTVLTVAIAHAILEEVSYEESLKAFAREYPDAGYGGFFYNWMMSDDIGPYDSWGNGSAMRVSPVGFAFDSVEEVLEEAEKTAVVTHDHPEGVIGAQATALAIFLARTGASPQQIKAEIHRRFLYDLDRTLEKIRPVYTFDVSCEGTVPEAILSFIESADYEDSIRNAVSLGGDSDTLACITGGIAQAYYGTIPQFIIDEVYERLPFHFIDVIDTFNDTFGIELYAS